MAYKARIKFDNREWIVVDNILFGGKKYFYIIEDVSDGLKDIENIEDYKGDFSIEFIYELENGNYKNVTDKDLISILSSEVAMNALNNKIDI